MQVSEVPATKVESGQLHRGDEVVVDTHVRKVSRPGVGHLVAVADGVASGRIPRRSGRLRRLRPEVAPLAATVTDSGEGFTGVLNGGDVASAVAVLVTDPLSTSDWVTV